LKPKDVAALAKVCRAHGIKKISVDGVKAEIEMDPAFVPPVRLSKKQKAKEEELKSILEASEEDIALYSSPSFDPETAE